MVQASWPELRCWSKYWLNDNAPEVTITSVTTSVPENFPPGAITAFISVHDQDSGDNGHTSCSISGNLPFKLEKLDDNYYRLVTEKTMDRELTSQYNITVTATDQELRFYLLKHTFHCK